MQTRLPGIDLPGELLEAVLDCALPLVRRLRAEEFRHELFQILQSSCIVVLKTFAHFSQIFPHTFHEARDTGVSFTFYCGYNENRAYLLTMIAPLESRTATKMQCKYTKRGRLEPLLVKRHFRSPVQPGSVVQCPGWSRSFRILGHSSKLVVRSRVRTCAVHSHLARGCHSHDFPSLVSDSSIRPPYLPSLLTHA